MDKPPVALALSGSDPTGGAGLQADIRIFERFGVHPTAVPTLYTVQDSLEVKEVHSPDADFFYRQLHTLTSDISPQAIKIGAIADHGIFKAIIKFLNGFPSGTMPPVVWDPVLNPTQGKNFAANIPEELIKELMSKVTLITPNLVELEAIWGVEARSGAYSSSWLHQYAVPASVLIKGGHSNGDPVDIFHLPNKSRSWQHKRFNLPKGVHGTGCFLSSAVTACLAHGNGLEPSVETAIRFVQTSIQASYQLGKGAGFGQTLPKKS